MARKRLVAGNWKLHGSTDMCREMIGALRTALKDLDRVEVAILPPFPYLPIVSNLAAESPLAWGAQDLSAHESGAYTGEVSATMLREYGCTFVLCGHSERRTYHGESNELVADKAAAALAGGLVPIICVGETLEQREAGSTEEIVGGQIDAVVAELGVPAFDNAVIAYEPVWAIGTGRTATPDQAQAVHQFIRSKFESLDDTIAGRLRILYGGSVKGSNAADLFAKPDIDGGLIGGASLQAGEFLDICGA